MAVWPTPPRRRPSAAKVSKYTRFSTSMSTPTGPAGGDLSGNYPNPQVASLAHAVVGPATYPAGSGALLTDLPMPSSLPPDGPAGGDLSGTYPNPNVANVGLGALPASVVVLTGGAYPAGNGSAITDLPPPDGMTHGVLQLDGTGAAVLPTSAPDEVFLTWFDNPGTGTLFYAPGTNSATSTAGGFDSGKFVSYLTFKTVGP